MKSPPYHQIKYSPEQDIMSSQWLRVVNSNEYRLSLENICQQLEMNKALHWLADFSRMTSPNISDQNWTIELLGHHLPNTKLRRIALVLPDDLFLEVVVEKLSYSLLKMVDNKVQIGHFTDMDVAQRWLVSSNDLEEGLFRNASPFYTSTTA